MTDIHTIRLHAAWKRMDECDHASPDNQERSVSLPDASLADCAASMATYQRRFNRPTGLNDSVSVHLHSSLLSLATAIKLNGESLGAPFDPFIDLSTRLEAHNLIEIVIAKPQFKHAATASARIEIKPLAEPGSDPCSHDCL